LGLSRASARWYDLLKMLYERYLHDEYAEAKPRRDWRDALPWLALLAVGLYLGAFVSRGTRELGMVADEFSALSRGGSLVRFGPARSASVAAEPAELPPAKRPFAAYAAFAAAQLAAREGAASQDVREAVSALEPGARQALLSRLALSRR
jgi:hypothetical protein